MKKLILIILALCILSASFSLVSCDAAADGAEKPTIVCSIFVEYDFVKNIVGDAAEVILLQKNGVDMHSFEPTAKNILDIAHADVLVTLGGASDTWVEGVLASAEGSVVRHIQIFSFCRLLHEETPDSMRDHGHGHDHDHDHGEGGLYDEHVWMSPCNAKSIVSGLCRELSVIFPEHKNEFEANADGYIEKLDALDEDFRGLSLEDKPFIVADRFPFLYFADEYGLDFLGAFPGCSSETHASFETLVYMIGEVEKRGASSIFITDGSSLGIAERISEETGAKIYVFNSVQSITDARLEEGIGYLELMKENFEILAEAYK